MDFKLTSQYKPTGDQPEAIRQLVEGVNDGVKYQTLLGVTGSGKTFTIANVIEKVQRPTLILSHNKTLAAQLYGEFKSFFPENAVEYFVSYYDYYQPEAYLPNSDTYIEKDLAINDEIEKLRLATTTALLSGRRDVVVVSSVSCLYGMGNPEDFYANTITIQVGQQLDLHVFLRMLSDNLYQRNEISLERGNFRVKGDTVDVFMADTDFILRVSFWGDEIEEITSIDPLSNMPIESFEQTRIYPANLFVTTKERISRSLIEIGDDLTKQIEFFELQGRSVEAKRISERVNYDMEMIRELGHCSGIENYSRYFDGRKPGTRPFCLLDFFPKDMLLVIDESHVTIPQIRAMYGGDSARKKNLVEYGFRLPAAMDNRPLKFEEFEELTNQTIYVSATPADFELEKCEGVVVEQVIRPTGLLDPVIDVRPSLNQIDDLIEEIIVRAEKDERVLVTTLTKRMAEELQEYLVLYFFCTFCKALFRNTDICFYDFSNKVFCVIAEKSDFVSAHRNGFVCTKYTPLFFLHRKSAYARASLFYSRRNIARNSFCITVIYDFKKFLDFFFNKTMKSRSKNAVNDYICLADFFFDSVCIICKFKYFN